ncbi:MAG: glycosyltransferase [Actinomycetota bacterium]|nr:glycosyltransferase [Actinomycetota bacterium]
MPDSPPESMRAFGLAVPFYRNVALLAEVLQSIVDQTDRQWRCVVVDDCSPEEGAAAAVAALHDERVTYVRNEQRLGIAGNFERCFDVLGTELALPIVAVVHSDDLLRADFVQQMRSAHAQHPEAAAIAGQVDVIGPDGQAAPTLADRVKYRMWPDRQHVFTMAGEAGLSRALKGLFWYCPAVSYRLDRLPQLRWDGRWQQVMDLDLYGRMLLAGEQLVLWPHEVYRYRRHDATSTSVNTESLLRFYEEAEVSDELARAAAALGWKRAAWSGRLRVASRLHCVLVAVSMLLHRKPRAAVEATRLAFSPRAPRRRPR